MSMRIWDPHFLRYAGAEPAKQMRKEQRQARNAYVAGLVFEKPLDSPDRPSNMDRAYLESVSKLADIDNPSKNVASLSAFKPPLADDQDPTHISDSKDNPSNILHSIGDGAQANDAPPPPSPETVSTDDPSLITAGIGKFHAPEAAAAPTEVSPLDLPAWSRPQVDATSLDVPADQRAAPAPETDTGRLVSQSA